MWAIFKKDSIFIKDTLNIGVSFYLSYNVLLLQRKGNLQINGVFLAFKKMFLTF